MMAYKSGSTKFAWLSIAVALATIGLKLAAYWLTNSIGLLSDALESSVNLVAGVIALIALLVAELPPDAEHKYGHHKAEYFSSGVEGSLIVVAAITIVVSAVNRFIHPQPLIQLDVGLIVSAVAAILNLAAARILLQASRHYHSVALEANARHLMTDVWTSVAVIVGVGIVAFTNWAWLDPLIAILIAVQIMIAGGRLVQGAVLGLMDTALSPGEVEKIEKILDRQESLGITYHALRTRRSGRQRFVSVHIQVPGAWSVQRGHTLLEKIEREIRQELAPISVFTHLEPVEDPASWQDIELNRLDD